MPDPDKPTADATAKAPAPQNTPLVIPPAPPAVATSAADELAERERELFGDDPVLGPDGRPLERGHGSKYQMLPLAQRAHFDALTALVAAEQEASAAEAKHNDALERVAAAQMAVEAAKAAADAVEAAKAEREKAKAA
jgi:hypothetical protein